MMCTVKNLGKDQVGNVQYKNFLDKFIDMCADINFKNLPGRCVNPNQKRTASWSVDLKINIYRKPVSTLLLDSSVSLHRDLHRQIVMDSGVRVEKAWKSGSRGNTRALWKYV